MLRSGRSRNSEEGGSRPTKKRKVRKSKSEDNLSKWEQISKNATKEVSPLSNELIMKKIFSYLPYNDLVSCSYVNDFWRSLADSMMNFYRITPDLSQNRKKWGVEVEQLFGLVSKGYIASLKEVAEELRTSGEEHPISIFFRVIHSHHIHRRISTYEPFLTEFGHRVHVFEFTGTLYMPLTFKNLARHLSHFQNIRVLKFSRFMKSSLGDDSDSGSDSDSDDGLAPGNESVQLPHLWQIHFGSVIDSEHLQRILRMAPNVREILEFPLKEVESLSFGALQALKSVRYPDPKELRSLQKLPQLVSWYRTLADNGVHLRVVEHTNFNLSFAGKHWDPVPKVVKSLKVEFYRVLKSSQDTVEILIIPPTKSYDYYHPTEFPLRAVKLIQFKPHHYKYSCFQEYNNYRCWMGMKYCKGGDECHYFHEDEVYDIIPTGKMRLKNEEVSMARHPRYHFNYFPEGMDFGTMFPKLEGLEIGFNLLTRDLFPNFPTETFGPEMLGAKVGTLKIQGASSKCFPSLVTLFPHVKNFEVQSTIPHFKEVFPIIAQGWPALKSLTVFINLLIGFDERNSEGNCKYHNIDSALTGIPEETCVRLGDGVGPPEPIITEEEICEIQSANVSLLNLTSLEKLEFVVDDYKVTPRPRCHACRRYQHLPAFITEVAASHAFKKCPFVSVYVKTREAGSSFDGLQDVLSPISRYIKLANTYSTADIPF